MRPRDTVKPSRTSATNTNKRMTRAVKYSEIAAAETMASVIDNSIVMRRARRLSNASLRIPKPENSSAAAPMMLMFGNGSQR